MNDKTLLGPWVRRFPLEHLAAERTLARNTQRSYRDALTQLIPFVAGKRNQSVDRLTVVDISPDLVRLFLADLEQARQCAITTRNQRLAAVHALARFVGEHSPEHIAWSDPFPSKNPAKSSSPISTNPRWMRSWALRIVKPPKVAAIMLRRCFSPTPERAPRKPHNRSLANSI